MTKTREIYRCTICGNVVEVVNPGAVLSCCGQPMMLMKENTTDGAKEKHVPVIEPIEGGYKVNVGSVEHPMQPEHYIQFIEVHSDDAKCIKRVYFEPHEVPILESKCKCATPHARAYCNLHGLYRS